MVNDALAEATFVEQLELQADICGKSRLAAAHQDRRDEQMELVDQPRLDRVGGEPGTAHGEVTVCRRFQLPNGVVYHTYSAYARGLDALWGLYPWLDRAPKGRNETGPWFRRHDEYGEG